MTDRKQDKNDNDALKTATRVIKRIGPRAGFRTLSFCYMQDGGVIVHVTTSVREEAEALEKFFDQYGVEVDVVQEMLP